MKGLALEGSELFFDIKKQPSLHNKITDPDFLTNADKENPNLTLDQKKALDQIFAIQSKITEKEVSWNIKVADEILGEITLLLNGIFPNFKEKADYKESIELLLEYQSREKKNFPTAISLYLQFLTKQILSLKSEEDFFDKFIALHDKEIFKCVDGLISRLQEVTCNDNYLSAVYNSFRKESLNNYNRNIRLHEAYEAHLPAFINQYILDNNEEVEKKDPYATSVPNYLTLPFLTKLCNSGIRGNHFKVIYRETLIHTIEDVLKKDASNFTTLVSGVNDFAKEIKVLSKKYQIEDLSGLGEIIVEEFGINAEEWSEDSKKEHSTAKTNWKENKEFIIDNILSKTEQLIIETIQKNPKLIITKEISQNLSLAGELYASMLKNTTYLTIPQFIDRYSPIFDFNENGKPSLKTNLINNKIAEQFINDKLLNLTIKDSSITIEKDSSLTNYVSNMLVNGKYASLDKLYNSNSKKIKFKDILQNPILFEELKARGFEYEVIMTREDVETYQDEIAELFIANQEFFNKPYLLPAPFAKGVFSKIVTKIKLLDLKKFLEKNIENLSDLENREIVVDILNFAEKSLIVSLLSQEKWLERVLKTIDSTYNLDQRNFENLSKVIFEVLCEVFAEKIQNKSLNEDDKTLIISYFKLISRKNNLTKEEASILLTYLKNNKNICEEDEKEWILNAFCAADKETRTQFFDNNQEWLKIVLSQYPKKERQIKGGLCEIFAKKITNSPLKDEDKELLKTYFEFIENDIRNNTSVDERGIENFITLQGKDKDFADSIQNHYSIAKIFYTSYFGISESKKLEFFIKNTGALGKVLKYYKNSDNKRQKGSFKEKLTQFFEVALKSHKNIENIEKFTELLVDFLNIDKDNSTQFIKNNIGNLVAFIKTNPNLAKGDDRKKLTDLLFETYEIKDKAPNNSRRKKIPPFTKLIVDQLKESKSHTKQEELLLIDYISNKGIDSLLTYMEHKEINLSTKNLCIKSLCEKVGGFGTALDILPHTKIDNILILLSYVKKIPAEVETDFKGLTVKSFREIIDLLQSERGEALYSVMKEFLPDMITGVLNSNNQESEKEFKGSLLKLREIVDGFDKKNMGCSYYLPKCVRSESGWEKLKANASKIRIENGDETIRDLFKPSTIITLRGNSRKLNESCSEFSLIALPS